MKPAISSAVAHDVKNRLVILGEALAKLAAMHLDADAQSQVSLANQQAMLLTGTLVEWLTLHNASSNGGLRATPHEEEPEAFLDDLLAEAHMLAAGRFTLVKQAAADLPSLWFFDRQLVRLALDSALYNALRFAHSRIVIGARRDGPLLCFYVHDDGPGVQATPSATSTGMGMTLCEQVAKAHRNRGLPGHCALRDHDRHGAIFELYLP